MNTRTDPAELAQGEALLSPFGVDLAEAARLGAQANGVEVVQIVPPAGLIGVPASIPVALKRGDKPEVLSVATLFDAYRQHPQRKSGQAVAQTFESFCNLVNRHKTPDSAIFADTNWQKPTLTAVIDYHEQKSAGLPANGKHRVHYAFPLSEEWRAWVASNGKPMEQREFAEFLEDRVPELSAPTEAEAVLFEREFATRVATPAQVVELSRGLRVHVESKIKNQTTLQTGEGQIAWEEVHNGEDGKPLKVPGIFLLSIAPFYQGDKIRIPVRLRYRPSGAKIVWMYQIYRPDQAITDHVSATLKDAARLTELPTFEGTPEMSAS
jgi:uncharacterized protein YfdQ (DUF2303 family)